jgi:hypothetical protein
MEVQDQAEMFRRRISKWSLAAVLLLTIILVSRNGHSLSWSLITAFLAGWIAKIGLTLLMPWSGPVEVQQARMTTFVLAALYFFVALPLDAMLNDLSTMARISIASITWWLSPFLAILSIFALVRLKNGDRWPSFSRVTTVVMAVTFVSLLVLSIGELSNLQILARIYSSTGSRRKAAAIEAMATPSPDPASVPAASASQD